MVVLKKEICEGGEYGSCISFAEAVERGGGSMEVERRLDELLPRAAWTAEWPSVRYIPSRDGHLPLVHRLRQEGVECFLPSEAVRRFRFSSSSSALSGVLPELLKIDGTCGEMKACVSLVWTGSVLQEKRRIGIESPMVGKWEDCWKYLLPVGIPMAGAGRTYSWGYGSCDGGNPFMIKRLILRDGVFMWRSRMESVWLVILFETDAHGNYKLNLLLSNTEIEHRLSAYVSREILHEVRSCLFPRFNGCWRMINPVFGSRYDDGRVAGGYVVHPCVEINLRMNMGVVSRLFLIVMTFLPSSGAIRGWNITGAEGRLWKNHHRCLSAYPLKIAQDGRILQWVFATDSGTGNHALSGVCGVEWCGSVKRIIRFLK